MRRDRWMEPGCSTRSAGPQMLPRGIPGGSSSGSRQGSLRGSGGSGQNDESGRGTHSGVCGSMRPSAPRKTKTRMRSSRSLRRSVWPLVPTVKRGVQIVERAAAHPPTVDMRMKELRRWNIARQVGIFLILFLWVILWTAIAVAHRVEREREKPLESSSIPADIQVGGENEIQHGG